MTFARDHEELLAFLLGQMVKERVRMHQAYHYEQPDHVTVKITDFDKKVRLKLLSVFSWMLTDGATLGTRSRNLRYCAVPQVEAVCCQRLHRHERCHPQGI
jgi:hypothetical protein